MPSKYGSHMHLLEDGSQWAPIPQIIPSHRCLQRPFMQTWVSAHESVFEHMSLVHCPPGKGFPMYPSLHLQVGSELVIMHWAPGAQMIFLHTEKSTMKVLQI